MRVVAIALKDILIVLRDLKALAMIILMPLILIVILGSALGPMFAGGSGINPFTVAVVTSESNIGQQFVEIFEDAQLRELVSLELLETEAAAMELLDKQQIVAAVIFPPSTQNMLDMQEQSSADMAQYFLEMGEGGNSPWQPDTQTVNVIGDPGEELRVAIIKGIVQSYTEQYSLVYASTSRMIETLLRQVWFSKAGLDQSFDSAATITQGSSFSHTFTQLLTLYQQQFNVDIMQLGEEIGNELITKTAAVSSLFEQSSEQGNWISAFQYYTAAMTMMFVLFGAMQGVQSILEEKDQYTLLRLFSTKATKTEVLIGKMLSTLLICLLQITVLILATKYAFGVHWGDSYSGLAALTLAISFAATGFVMFLASLAKTTKMASGLQNIGIQLMALLGGCMFPIYVFPPVMRQLSKGTITWWGLRGYMDLMLGKGIVDIGQSLFLLTAMGAVFLSLGIWRLELE